MAIVEKEQYMLKVAAYIHFNPLMLHLAENIKDYPYSSYMLFSGSRGTGPLLDEEIRELGARNYQGFAANVPKDEMEAFGKELNKNTVLGSDSFVEMVN